jgi:hypothetical protein
MTNLANKPKPIELCLERIQSSESDRYVRCTAQVGRELGLGLGIDGRILWCERNGVGCEIWVSADQRLMAYCPADTPGTVLYRAGRMLALPRERPVVLRHRDELELAGTRFRVHVHGTTERVHPPSIVRTLARAAATATLALAVGGSAGCDSRSTVGDAQPDAAAGPDVAEVPSFIFPKDAAPTEPTGPALDGASIDGEESTDEPIEVLESPPL